MKNYSSKRAKRGKTAYRTPSPIRYKLIFWNKTFEKKRKKFFYPELIRKISNGASRFFNKSNYSKKK